MLNQFFLPNFRHFHLEWVYDKINYCDHLTNRKEQNRIVRIKCKFRRNWREVIINDISGMDTCFDRFIFC